MLEVTVCDGRVHEELPMARLFVVDGWERERDSRTGGAFDFSALTGTHTEVITLALQRVFRLQTRANSRFCLLSVLFLSERVKFKIQVE